MHVIKVLHIEDTDQNTGKDYSKLLVNLFSKKKLLFKKIETFSELEKIKPQNYDAIILDGQFPENPGDQPGVDSFHKAINLFEERKVDFEKIVVWSNNARVHDYCFFNGLNYYSKQRMKKKDYVDKKVDPKVKAKLAKPRDIVKMVCLNHSLTHLQEIWRDYKEHIEIGCTIIIIILTFLSIVVTYQSIVVSEKIGKIEVYLASQEEKKEVMSQITLAKDLLQETLQNKKEVSELLIPFLQEYKNRTETRPDFLKTSHIQQAKDMITFGSANLRIKLDDYLDIVSTVKGDIQEIEKATRNQDTKIRLERFNSALNHAKILLSGRNGRFNIDEFIEDIKTYLQETDDYYKKIDRKAEEMLIKFDER
ncbi:hypothetical protein HYV84_03490 [Candidatus Woesearchaeota archaeon]|nr:hypothetical protein [Candidatus Woesearchaeota archaeon]